MKDLGQARSALYGVKEYTHRPWFVVGWMPFSAWFTNARVGDLLDDPPNAHLIIYHLGPDRIPPSTESQRFVRDRGNCERGAKKRRYTDRISQLSTVGFGFPEDGERGRLQPQSLPGTLTSTCLKNDSDLKTSPDWTGYLQGWVSVRRPPSEPSGSCNLVRFLQMSRVGGNYHILISASSRQGPSFSRR